MHLYKEKRKELLYQKMNKQSYDQRLCKRLEPYA
jgi:hypothetical protein